MRRNSTDKNIVALVLFAMTLLIAQVLSSLYPFIPSLAGFLFCYALLVFENEEKRWELVLTFVYLSMYESFKGFYLFSYALLFILFYSLAMQKIRYMTSCHACLLVLYVSVGYIGHYAINIVLSYFFNTPFPYFSSMYLYAIGIDTLLAFAFLKVPR